MALTTRVWGAGKLVLLGGALLLTYVIFAAAAMRLALKTRDVVVPTLAGKTVNDATAVLSQSGLNLKVEEGRRTDPKVPAGQILAQDPAPGASTRRERSVKVWVSAGPRATVVPALLGDTDRSAQSRLQQDGLELSGISEIRSAEYPPDAVIAQNPEGKEQRTQSRAAGQPRGTRGDLRDARSDRRQRRSCGGPSSREGFSSCRGRRSSVPGRACRYRAPSESAGGFSDRARRADFSRGQPVTVRIAPSILSADFTVLGAQIAAVERGGADLIHVDVMDGHFVPNLTIGVPVVRSIRKVATIPLDVHLMIEEPDRYLDAFVTAGAAMISVHLEVLPHLHRTLQAIKELGARAGVALNPSTPVGMLEEVAGMVDHVLVMSVNPGFGGQTFIPRSESKIQAVRALLNRQGNAAPIEVDGGIDASNVARIVEAGASILVAGTSIFGTGDPEQATRDLRAAATAKAGV